MNSLNAIAVFFCGFGGSMAVEIVVFNQQIQEHPDSLPLYYRRCLFWIGRVLLAIVGGGLAVAYQIHTPLLAANIGAATPLIINAFAQGVRPMSMSFQDPPPALRRSK